MKQLSLLWVIIFYYGISLGFISFSPLLDDKGMPKIERGAVVGFVSVPVGAGRNSQGVPIPTFKRYEARDKGESLRFKGSFGEFDSEIPWTKDASFEESFRALNYEWASLDKQKGLLFRPFCFYDVMGVLEFDFHDGSRCNPVNFALYPPLSDMDREGFVKLDEKKYGSILKTFPGRRALCGSHFRVISNDELRQKLDEKSKKFIPVGVAGIRVDDGYELVEKKGLVEAFKETDIRYLQEKHPGAVFQVGSCFDTFDRGIGIRDNFIEDILYRCGRWGNAVLGTMGGTIIRKYVLPTINLLEGLVHAEKIEMDPSNPGLVWWIKKDLDAADVGKIKVGIHENVMVTSGFSPAYFANEKAGRLFSLDMVRPRIEFFYRNGFIRPEDDPVYVFNSFIDKEKMDIRVDQVFVGSLDLNHGKNPEARGLTAKNSKLILKAAYKGTILAAALRSIERREKNPDCGPQEVFLSMIGTSFSGGQIEWIVELFEEQELIDLIAGFDLLVYLVIYPTVQIKEKLTDDVLNRFNACAKRVFEKAQKLGKVENLGIAI